MTPAQPLMSHSSTNEKEQMEMLKREKMNEIYTQRMHEKMKEQQQQTSAPQQHDDDDDL